MFVYGMPRVRPLLSKGLTICSMPVYGDWRPVMRYLVYGVPPVSHVCVRHASGETSGEQGPDDVLADWLTLLVIRCLSAAIGDLS